LRIYVSQVNGSGSPFHALPFLSGVEKTASLPFYTLLLSTVSPLAPPLPLPLRARSAVVYSPPMTNNKFFPLFFFDNFFLPSDYCVLCPGIVFPSFLSVPSACGWDYLAIFFHGQFSPNACQADSVLSSFSYNGPLFLIPPPLRPASIPALVVEF